MKKIIIVILSIIIVSSVGVYIYKDNEEKNNFQIADCNDDSSGEEILWTDNSKYNKYDISFGVLNGNDIKKIISKKNTYDMKISSNVEDGDLSLKIYNDKKIIFQKKGNIKDNITINENDSKNLKVEIDGNKAKGHVLINLS